MADDDGVRPRNPLPRIGAVPLASFPLEDAERAMRRLDSFWQACEDERARAACSPEAPPVGRSSRWQYSTAHRSPHQWGARMSGTQAGLRRNRELRRPSGLTP